MTRLGGKYDDCAKTDTSNYARNAYEQRYPWTSYSLAVIISALINLNQTVIHRIMLSANTVSM